MSTPEETTARQRLGAGIRRARVSAGMTQAELSHALGVASTQISRWETGGAFPMRHLDSLQRVLGVRAEDLLGMGANGDSAS